MEVGQQMVSCETVVAARDVTVRPDHLINVQISEDPAEDFWRVQVRNASTSRQMSSTTVGDADSFLWHLIQAAIDGDAKAWHELARWGHGSMGRPRVGLRSIA